MQNKKGAVNSGTILAAVVGLVMLTVLVSMLPDLIYTSASKVSTLSTMYSGNATTFGSTAASLGGQIDDWTGYFWVIGPLLLIILSILGVFLSRRR